MFGKSALVLRALFITAIVGSLVACTFEDDGSDEEEQGSTSALDRRHQNKDKDGTEAEGADSSTSGHDSSVDAGGFDSSSVHTDGGFGGDGGWWGDSGSDGGHYKDGGSASDSGHWVSDGGLYKDGSADGGHAIDAGGGF